MQTKILTFLLLLASVQAFSQANVTNVVTQISDERDKVIITYDLARKAGVSAYNVSVKITLDDELVSAQALSGDVGPNIPPWLNARTGMNAESRKNIFCILMFLEFNRQPCFHRMISADIDNRLYVDFAGNITCLSRAFFIVFIYLD